MQSIIKRIKNKAISNVLNIPGWHTNRKIVVFESDDWGSIRMPSLSTYSKLLKSGLKIEDHYNRNDSLATTNDLNGLFEILTLFKDKNRNYPVITANCLVANPDFENIRASKFEKYHYELFTETLKRHKGCEHSFEMWKEGIRSEIFRPQFHGREHLNISTWMEALQNKHSETLLAFDNNFWGQLTSFPGTYRQHFLSENDVKYLYELSNISEIISDGLKQFETIFGYASQSYIATNFNWHPLLEETLAKCGVKYIQGQRKQLIPRENRKEYSKKIHYTGQRNNFNQLYMVRNAIFEPSMDKNIDWVNNCLKGISIAFKWNKPAIVSCHRVNFIGSIDPTNRDRNLKSLKTLLFELTKRWPEVEFMSSDQLGQLIY